MSIRILNRSFSGGEITPELFGRLELSKVQEALALCRNFITLPHGPVINRPGTEFVEEVKDSANPTRLIPFSYNNTQTFAIQLGAGYFRFHTHGATLQYSAPAAYNAGTAYNKGDMCSNAGANYYCLASTTGNAPPNATYWYALPADMTYEIPNPYAAADLMDIRYTQSADVLTLVHPNYPIMELRRYGATNWQTQGVNFGSLMPIPAASGLAGSPVAHTYLVQGIGIYSDHNVPVWFATPLSAPSVAVSNDLTQKGAYNTVIWNAVPGVQRYCLYKLSGGVYHLIGMGSGCTFKDDSSVTIGTAQPYQPYDPSSSHPAPSGLTATPYAASGQATVLTATPTGAGTTSYSYVCTSLDESGNESYQSSSASCVNNLLTAGNFNTLAIPPVAGAIRYNIYKQSFGAWGYIGQAATPSFVDNNITPDISRTPPLAPSNTMLNAGDYPAAVAYYQQRRVFAGSANQPQNVWATRSGTEYDMNYTIPTRDDNRLAFKIASRDASAIRHIVSLNDLLFLSASCEWRCTASGGVLTPTTINVQPQSYNGANNVQPVVTGSAVLYAAARGGHIRQINYNWQINGYQSTDSSIFAPHLFDYNTITDMAYSRGPIPILWCVSSSGKLLGMTYLPEQQIAAWHQHATGENDAFESVCTIAENNEDMLYCIVRRTMANGVTKRFVERLHTRLYAAVADCHYVDCGMTYNAASVNAKSGSFVRSGTTMTCAMPAHGLANGLTYWFHFSDSSFGAPPGGQGYVVTYGDANTFTLTVPDSGATSGTVTYIKKGTFARIGETTISCTINGHVLTDQHTYWFHFSDNSLGALPGGAGYVVTVQDANTFTISVQYAAPLTASQAGMSGAIDGANTAFDLTGNAGQAVPALNGSPSLYKTDWQGKQLQYASARTNLLTYSQAFDNAVWGKSQCTATADSALAPDGTLTAETIAASAGATNTFVPQTNSTNSLAGQTVTFSVYAKIGTIAANSGIMLWLRDGAGNNVANTIFNLSTGAIATPGGGSAATQSLGNGWYRWSVTGTFPSGAATGWQCIVDPIGTPVAGETYFLWGAQLEAASAPTSYISTTSAPVTATDYALTSPAHVVFANAPAAGSTLTWDGSYFSATGTLTQLPTAVSGLTWLEGMKVNILADGAVMPQQTVSNGTVTFPVGVTQVHVGLPITAQLQTPPAAQSVDPAMAQGLSKNINKVYLRTYRSSGILAGPDFNTLVPYRQRSTENPGSPPNLVSDEVEIVLNSSWGMSGQICIQQSDPLPLDIASMTLEIAVGGGV